MNFARWIDTALARPPAKYAVLADTQREAIDAVRDELKRHRHARIKTSGATGVIWLESGHAFVIAMSGYHLRGITLAGHADIRRLDQDVAVCEVTTPEPLVCPGALAYRHLADPTPGDDQ